MLILHQEKKANDYDKLVANDGLLKCFGLCMQQQQQQQKCCLIFEMTRKQGRFNVRMNLHLFFHCLSNE